MRLLLPPSEAKTAGGRSRPLDRRSGTDGPLAAARATVVDALHRLVEGDREQAVTALALPAAVAEAALRANAAVSSSPTTPALRRYAGVVYDGLGFDRLTQAQQRVAGREVLIFSGLLGVVRGDEPVPDYRVPAKAVLPGVGIVGSFWRPVLADVVPSLLGRGLVVDLRSTDYAAMWRPAAAQREGVVAVRVLSPTAGGRHAVISYNSKLAKGRLARELLLARARGEVVDSAEDVAAAWLRCEGARTAVVADSGLDLYTA